MIRQERRQAHALNVLKQQEQSNKPSAQEANLVTPGMLASAKEVKLVCTKCRKQFSAPSQLFQRFKGKMDMCKECWSQHKKVKGQQGQQRQGKKKQPRAVTDAIHFLAEAGGPGFPTHDMNVIEDTAQQDESSVEVCLCLRWGVCLTFLM